jgi:hypothetical protein
VCVCAPDVYYYITCVQSFALDATIRETEGENFELIVDEIKLCGTAEVKICVYLFMNVCMYVCMYVLCVCVRIIFKLCGTVEVNICVYLY